MSKETAINRLLPQAEVIYLHYSADNMEEYDSRLDLKQPIISVIENPGAFPEGVNEKNIITHPSTPRNKLIAETLQRLKYVQRTGQGVDIIYREIFL